MTHVDGGGLPAGTQLNGIYEIEKRIAIGGMGEVYIARVVQTGDKVAIKMILPEHADNDIIVDLFRREASTLHNLYHEAIVRYYVFSVDPALNRPYLSMEFADGPALGDRLLDGPLDEDQMAVLRRRVAGGLHAAHKLGIIHRDISPDNIILVDGQVEKAKIIDFGIAKSQANERTLIGSGFAGKLNYVSPEQLGLSGGEVTAKSDIYSLGLVFAQAAGGAPLPMGGSHAEVIDKRRVVPDLGTVPSYVRPMIEAMLQPEPADRPADMQEIAEWAPAGASGGPSRALGSKHDGTDAPVHPRNRRRRKQVQAQRRTAGRWVWIGGGAALAAASAVAAIFAFGERHVPSGPADQQAELAPLGIVAPPAVVGEAYAWTLPPFDLPRKQLELTIKIVNKLPPGLSVEAVGDGTARIEGTPLDAGDYDFDVLASASSGASAWHEVQLTVREAERIGVNQTPMTGLAESAPEQTPERVGGTANALAGGVEPSVATGGPGDLTLPGTMHESAAEGGFGAGASDGAPAASVDAPALGSQTGASGLPVIPAGDQDPAAGSVEPQVATGSPGALGTVALPADGSGATAVTGSDTPAMPQTDRPQGTASAGPAEDAAIAAIPAPENQPPTLLDPLGGMLDAVQGQEMNVRLGTFGDEEGQAGLRLDVQGTVPNGVSLRLAEGGVAQLYGTPAEFGDFDLRVAAVDPQGLVSRPVALTLSVAPPAANRAVREYILGYDGGDCFLSRPMELGPQLARIEVFAAESRVQPVLDFDAAFKRDMGFEANIGMRPISENQCSLIHVLDQVGSQALDNSLVIALDSDELAAGEALSGSIAGGEGARLYLLDHAGGLTDLSEFVEGRKGWTGFTVPISASGPQILIAAKPREGAGIPPTANLEELLGAAQRGQASLALGFFMMKG